MIEALINSSTKFLCSVALFRFLCGGAWVKLKSTGRWHAADGFYVGNEQYFRLQNDDGTFSSFHSTFNDIEESDTNSRI